jgi:hypothetical protein
MHLFLASLVMNLCCGFLKNMKKESLEVAGGTLSNFQNYYI